MPSVTPNKPAQTGAKSKQSKVVILRLSTSALAKWPCETPLQRPPLTSKQSSASASNNSNNNNNNNNNSNNNSKSDSPKNLPSTNVKKEDTLQQGGIPSSLQVPERKKPGPPKGTKRKLAEANLNPNGTPKPRGKPGPKKRKLDGDETARPWTTPAATTAGHKLGPKANQGAINAGLRALDRSGKPCRKWGKKSFAIKTFTGQIWTLSTWSAPKRAEVQIDGDGVTTSNSEEAQSYDNTPRGHGPPSSDAGRSGEAPKEGSAVLMESSPPPVVVG